MNQWFVSRQGKLKGPYALPQLQEMVKTGELKRADLVCPEGGVPILASRLTDLFPASSYSKPNPALAGTAPRPVSSESARAHAPTDPSSPGRKSRLPAFLVVGGILIGLVPIVGLALLWALRDTEKTAAVDPPLSQAKAAEPLKIAKVAELAPEPPPDPRAMEVKKAVDKGVAYVKSQMPTLMAMRGGYVGLNGLALLESGVPPNDPVILRFAERIRATGPAMNTTYDLAAALFFLNRLDELQPLEEADRKLARTLALRIIAGQLSTGIWGYGGVVMNPQQEAKLLAALQDDTYRPVGRATPSMSNTQFAMLAVWGARRHGVPVRAPLLALGAYFHANQHPDGHWHYPGNSLAATSTCAGLIALAIEMALLEDSEFASGRQQPDLTKKKADLDKAFTFVAKTIGRKKTDPGGGVKFGYGGAIFDADAWGDLYFLWTLERVGVIYSKDLIAGKNWYDWGCPIVLATQLANGSWDERPPRRPGGPLIDTPFALLFLQRANLARDLTQFMRTRVNAPK